MSQQQATITVSTDFMVNTLNSLVTSQKDLNGILRNSLAAKEQQLANMQLALDAARKSAAESEARATQLSRQLDALAETPTELNITESTVMELPDNIEDVN